MDMKQKYQSKIMEAIHEEAQALFETGAIDEKRMAEYDHACLVSKPNKTPAAVKPNAPARKKQPTTPAYAHAKGM
jgi:DNA-binding transcriptional regulator YiaG